MSDVSILPALLLTATDFEFSYSRRDLSLANTAQAFEYGSDFIGWISIPIPAAAGATPSGIATITITITVTDTGSTDGIKVSIPINALGGQVFGRLKVVLGGL